MSPLYKCQDSSLVEVVLPHSERYSLVWICGRYLLPCDACGIEVTMNVYSDGPLLHRFIQQLDVVSHHRIEQLMSLLQEMVMNMKATHNIMKAHKC